MSDVIELTQQLIAQASVTPNDNSCQTILSARLAKLGFTIEHLPFNNVSNLWARHGTQSPLFVFVGHTDVVPPGPTAQWTSPPFIPEVRNGYLYGRGAADMKGSLAAMLVACENFINTHPAYQGSIAWLITSDEEGPSIDGTARVVEVLKNRQQQIDWCLVGEPSSDKQFGDTIKIGRRGSLSAKLIIHGKQGHIAYPQHAVNPIHAASAMLAELVQTTWDQGNAFFQPTSFQISNIHAGTGVGNVIPGELEIHFNFRYAPVTSAEQLQQRVHTLLEKHALQFTLDWQHSGQPFITERGPLVTACCNAIETTLGVTPQLSTSGGTSDGRFIAPTGAQIVEFGPTNSTIHQIDECVAVNELIKLSEIYQRLLEQLFS